MMAVDTAKNTVPSPLTRSPLNRMNNMNKSSALKKTRVALAIASAMVFKPTYAATFNVNSTVDQPSACTFAAAIAALHEETPTGMARCSNTSNLELGINDQITFDNIALITGINSQFEITRSVQINPGGSRVRFVGTDESRIFQISNENPVDEDDDQDEDDNDIEVNVTIDNVELTRGRANSNDESGGAILVRDADTFTLINSVVAGNMVTGNNNLVQILRCEIVRSKTTNHHLSEEVLLSQVQPR